MEWARVLAYITGTVDQELLLRNEYLAAENRVLKTQLKGRLRLSDAQRAKLGEIGHRLGRKSLGAVATAALPRELSRSLACTNIIENVMGTVRRVCRNVKYWRSPSMAMRWTAAAMMEAKKGFRRLKAYKQLPALRAALNKQSQQDSYTKPLAQIAEAA